MMRFLILITAMCWLCFPVKSFADDTVKMPSRNTKKAKIDESRLKPVQGYRFIITGKFGDKNRTMTLTEHFLDGRTHKESPKFYENLEYDDLVDITCQKKPIAMLTSSDPSIKPLIIEDH